jgi:hypothetical protein
MTATRWIGPYGCEDHKVGDRAFLVEKQHNTKGQHYYELRDTPPQTNQSFAYRLEGWCGTYNDLATYGAGAVEVVKIAKNGRLQVRQLDGDALDAFLDESGFPELKPAQAAA